MRSRGDNGTWSLTVYIAAGDRPLKRLRHADRWTAVVRACPLHAHLLEHELALLSRQVLLKLLLRARGPHRYDQRDQRHERGHELARRRRGVDHRALVHRCPPSVEAPE